MHKAPCIAAILLCLGPTPASAAAEDAEVRIIFINARAEDGRSLGHKRMVASREDWQKLLQASLPTLLEAEFGAKRFTYSTVAPGDCFVFRTRDDKLEGKKLYLDLYDTLEKAEQGARDARNNASYPSTIIEVGCHDGSGSAERYISESTFSCGSGGGSDSATVTVRFPRAAGDIFVLRGSTGRTGNLSLVSQRRKIDNLEAQLRELAEGRSTSPVSGLEGELSPDEARMRALAAELEQASRQYEEQLAEGIMGMCPGAPLGDPSWVDKAGSWTRQWTEQRRGCSFSVPRTDPRSCEFDPTASSEPDGVRG